MLYSNWRRLESSLTGSLVQVEPLLNRKERNSSRMQRELDLQRRKLARQISLLESWAFQHQAQKRYSQLINSTITRHKGLRTLIRSAKQRLSQTMLTKMSSGTKLPKLEMQALLAITSRYLTAEAEFGSRLPVALLVTED